MRAFQHIKSLLYYALKKIRNAQLSPRTMYRKNVPGGRRQDWLALCFEKCIMNVITHLMIMMMIAMKAILNLDRRRLQFCWYTMSADAAGKGTIRGFSFKLLIAW